ncbi:MAG: 3-hydroxy-3-methylglutaryl-CoA reductase, partial [Gammaproteobacteria bacterium]|nr:3-hydroxy-3-methylglutaryl-CoA reductase [Gammaproteobacteria bacterium]
MPVGIVGGADVRDAMLSAGAFAVADPYRATTHNKGIMNGVSAVVLATGNDTRAVESGAHAYAARNGTYSALTRWEKNNAGDLIGTIELPMPVGIVGGATRVHATAKLCLEIMQIKSAAQLGGIIASVGLVQNFSAMKALATEGIQRGHMSLHAKNVAIAAGAAGNEIEPVAQQLISDKTINAEAAEQILRKLRSR